MEKLDEFRKKIEAIDATIIKNLAERQALAKQIGQLKSVMGKAVLDPAREAQLREYYQTLCKEYGIDPVFIQDLFTRIISYSRSLQK